MVLLALPPADHLLIERDRGQFVPSRRRRMVANVRADPGRTQPRAAYPGAAAQTRVVSKARIRLDSRKSVRSFKGIICLDITHPVTKRKALFVNQGFTTHIDGLPKEESRAILNYLFEHCTRPEFQVRFRWRPHSVAFWDNRSVQHMALWDYYPQVRSGRRVTIKGDRPV